MEITSPGEAGVKGYPGTEKLDGPTSVPSKCCASVASGLVEVG